MKRPLSSLTLSFILAGSLLGAAHAKVMDRTLATVNGEAILLSEFEKNATPVLEQFKKVTPPEKQTPDRVSDIKKRVLDQMIEDRLLAQEAKNKAIRVSTLETDEGVKKVRQRFETEAEFKKELSDGGLTFEDFRKHIQDQLSVIKLIDQEVKAKTAPASEADAKGLYDSLQAIANDKPLPAGLTPSEVDEMRNMARALQHRFGERARARHILVRVDANAPASQRSEALKKIQDVQRRLKAGEDFTDLAKKYSDDPGSKDRGGDLGYFSRGDMVGPFDKAVFALQVGQTSDIVATDFGYHIIRLEEKKASSKMNFDDVKDDLREYLFQQRAAKKFESYVKDIRAKAAVKINNLE